MKNKNEQTKKEQKLAADFRRWLGEESLLRAAQDYLGGSGFGEFKVSNWIKREIPKTLLEGAALYHVAAESFDKKSAKRTGLVGDHFWQVFVVDKGPEKGPHDCRIIRYWKNVKWHDEGDGERYLERDGERYLVHRTWVSGRFPTLETEGSGNFPQENDNKDNRIWDIATLRPLPHLKSDAEDGWEWMDDEDKDQDKKKHAIRLRWEVKEEGRPYSTTESYTKDYGYAVKVIDTIGGIENDGAALQFDCVGGVSVIPVTTESIVAVLPNSILRNLLTQPQVMCHGFPAEDDPIKMLKPLLKDPEKRQRHLSDWSLNLGPIQKKADLGTIQFPQKIKDELKRAGVLKENGTAGEDYKDHSVFTVDIAAPEALLTYCLFFGLRSA